MLELPLVLLLVALSGGVGVVIGRLRGNARPADDARLQAVLEHSIDAAYRRDLRTDSYDYFSPALEHVMGVTPSEMQSMSVETLLDRIHPDDRGRVTAAIDESHGRRQGRVEYRFRGNSGEYRWIADNYAVEVDAYGRPTHRSGILRDVSEQKHAQEQVRTTLESIGDGFLACDAEWRIVYLNAAAERMLDLPREQLVGRSHWEIFPLTLGTPLEREYRLAATGETRDFEYLYAPWNRWFHIRSFPREGGGLSVYFRDITERKDAESALSASENRYRTLFESIEDGFCIVEVLLDDQGAPADYRFVETNPAFSAATGLVGAVGHTALDLVPGLDRWWVQTYGRVALTGEPTRFENHSEAMGRWFDVYAFRFGAAERRQVAIFFKNVTDRKAAELERVRLLDRERLARADAERASRLKDEFLATISHELRTPLNSILGWAQIITRGEADQATLAQGLGAIERNALAQARLIDDLLDMSRIASGLIHLDVQGVDLRLVMTAAIDAARPAAASKDLRLELHVDDEIGMVHGDATRLPQVAWNLLSNAIKFTSRGGMVRVSLTAAEDDHVRLTVADTGQGIAAEFLPHVFERFRQADASSTRAHGGLGLGLAIVKQIVELHGGRVSAHSDGPGLGSRFVVDLPRVAPAHEAGERRTVPPPNADSAALPVDVDLSNLTVLAVDDEPDALDVIRRVLEDRQARVLTATSAQEALRVFVEARPHVLVADIGMPHVDGYELIRQVRALVAQGGSAVPAAALTALARSEDRTRALLAGYQTHLAKPVRPVELIATVASLAGLVTSPPPER
jgi:PAS domain S-box-containing protein